MSAPAGAGAQQGLGAPKAAPTLGEAIDHLAADIQRLRIDFERFWSGALPLPPEELRQRIQVELRALRNVRDGSAVERFRLGDLEARFNSYSELFQRRLRDREEGRRRAGAAAALALAQISVPQVSAARYDPAKGIVLGRAVDPQAIAALYNGLAAGIAGTAGAGGEAHRFDLATFGAYLERQAAAIRDKTGCEEVHFRLATEDGKLKLKARPLTVRP